MDAVYNTIGKNYNSTRKADPYVAGRLRHFLNPKEGGIYLDIGCGTGNYTIALANTGLDFVGVEPAEEMLKEARNPNDGISWVQAIAERLPFDNDSFAGAIATLTIHHWTDLAQGFKEISRVLQPSARLVVFTATPRQMEGYWLNHYFPDMLRASIPKMPAFEAIVKCLTTVGFKIASTEKYFIKDDLQDKFLYSGKNNPAFYLDDAVRKGISSFSALANADEVQTGLAKLKTDLENGSFAGVKQLYDDEAGDYLFIVAEKGEALPV